jgi:hypothetical protein
MVGIHGSADIVRRRPALLAALLTAGVVGFTLLGQAPASAGPGTGCDPVPHTLSPKLNGPKSYTMLLRINKDKNIDDYANPDSETGGLRERIRDRDIFVINTRDKGSTPEEWVALAERLSLEFPCNRIISLNGLALDPTLPGYQFALTNNPEIWALALDWESGDWTDGRKQDPAIPPWTSSFGMTRGRIAKRLSLLGGSSDDELGPPGRRTGVVPAYYSAWDYGLIAKTADRRNHLRKERRPGLQMVQSQGYCTDDGPESFRGLANHLILQYRPRPRVKKIRNKKGKVIKKFKVKVKPRAVVDNLAMEISFSNTPDPSDPRPVASVPPGAAGKCTRVGLKRGVGAFLYWAHEDSIRALLNTPRICALRPPCE